MRSYQAGIVFCLTVSLLTSLFCYLKIKSSHLKANENGLAPVPWKRKSGTRQNMQVHYNKIGNTSPSNTSRVNIVTVRKIEWTGISGLVSAEDYQPNTTLERGYTYSREKKKKDAFASTFKFNFTAVNLRFAPLLKQNPFHVWIFHNRFKRYEDIGSHEDSSTKGLHVGNPNRLKNVILKAIQGKTIEVVVIGGSNSVGAGIKEGDLKGLYFNVFVDWWSKIFGNAKESKINIHKLAIGAMGSAFFTFCFKTFLDHPDDFDIVLVDTAVNYHLEAGVPAEPAEQLARTLLSSPSRPAVIFVNLVPGLGKDSVTGKVRNPTCKNLEDFGLVEITDHYKITSISLRDVVCPKIGNKRRVLIPNMGAPDLKHIGIKAHAQIAMVLINYTINNLRDVLYDLQKRTTEENVEISWYKIAKLPATLMIKKPTEIISSPLCWAAITPNRNQNVHHPSLDIYITENRGFLFKDLIKNKTNTSRSDSSQRGWLATNSGNLIRFSFNVPPWRYDSEIQSRSIIILCRTEAYVGEVCVDSFKAKRNCKRIASKDHYNRHYTIATRVNPGEHSLSVKTINDGLFVLSGILIGPPDSSFSGGV